MTYVPDHYRYPIPSLGMARVRYSAIDVAEVELGRDRDFPAQDARARLPHDSVLDARERRAGEHTERLRGLRRLMDRLLPEEGP